MKRAGLAGALFFFGMGIGLIARGGGGCGLLGLADLAIAAGFLWLALPEEWS